jgi:hypothetical protein
MGDPERSIFTGRCRAENVEVVNLASAQMTEWPNRVAGFSKELPVRDGTFRNVHIGGKPLTSEQDVPFEICFSENVRFVTDDGRQHVAPSLDRPPKTGRWKKGGQKKPGEKIRFPTSLDGVEYERGRGDNHER